MCWPLSELPEISGRVDDATTEMVEPDAVNDHAAQHGMIAVGQVPGIGQPAAARRDLPIVDGNVSRGMRGQDSQFGGAGQRRPVCRDFRVGTRTSREGGSLVRSVLE